MILSDKLDLLHVEKVHLAHRKKDAIEKQGKNLRGGDEGFSLQKS